MTMLKERLRINGVHQYGWLPTPDKWRTRSACSSHDKTRYLVLREKAFAHKNIRNIYNLSQFHLISDDGNELSFMPKKHEVCQPVRPGLDPTTFQPQRDRTNMGTEDREKQNL